MKEDIDKKLDQLNRVKKFWQPPPQIKTTKKNPEPAKPSGKYKAKLTKLEQQYNDIQMAVSRQNSILRGILNRNLNLSHKNYSKPTNYLIIKCLLAGGIVYGTIWAGIWGSQTDSENIVHDVLHRDLDRVKTDLITAYNDAVKFIGEQAHNLPENSVNIIEKAEMIMIDMYENIKSKIKPD